MTKENIDWKEFATQLLWNKIIESKNEDSGYDIMFVDHGDRGIHKGDIGHWRFCSYVDPFSYKKLTWKELALELGMFTDSLTWDGHDCKICPERNKCNAYFKDDPDQDRCNGWKYDPSYPVFRVGDIIMHNQKSIHDPEEVCKIVDIKDSCYRVIPEGLDNSEYEYFINFKDQNNWYRISK